MFNAKKKFFEEKIESVTKSEWDQEFKLSKSRHLREGVRQDRDRAIEAINQIDTALKTEKDKEKLEKMEKEKTAFTENVGRYEGQMLMIDKQINGFVGDETHEPIIGILEQVKMLAELKLMYKDFISHL